MTTLAVNAPRPLELGDFSHFPIIADDIIYEGAAVGLVAATGHARPLAAGDTFVGFCTEICDNTGGAAAAKNVLVRTRGQIALPVTGAVITDANQPVYASDDNAFSFSPVAGVFVGLLRQFVSAGVGIVRYDADGLIDPYGGRVWEALAAATLTLDVQDNGKGLWVTVDSTITLPAVATELMDVAIANGGAFGAVGVTVSPNAADGISGPNMAQTADKDIVNTKATARRGDYLRLAGGLAEGYAVAEIRGVWAKEA